MLKADNAVLLAEHTCSERECVQWSRCCSAVVQCSSLSLVGILRKVSQSLDKHRHTGALEHTGEKMVVKKRVKSRFLSFFFKTTTSVRCNLSAKVPPVLPDAAGGGTGCLLQT